jgi:1-acyl-sn-glycerol-3-phosphate acyltransferase
MKPLPQSYLLVSNHLSFFDPVVTLALARGMPLAKAEIRNYPIIGYAALKTGIIYVQREEKSSRKSAREAVVQALRQNRSVLVYPEGTISPKENELHPFKVGVFKSAHSAQKPIHAVSIQYFNGRGLWTAERSLLQQYFYQFSQVRQKIQLNFSEDLRKESPQRTAESSKEWIENKMN